MILYSKVNYFMSDPCKDDQAIGMQNKTIPDSYIMASSEYSPLNAASRARLGIVNEGSLTGAWSALQNDVRQWLLINLGKLTKVIQKEKRREEKRREEKRREEKRREEKRKEKRREEKRREEKRREEKRREEKRREEKRREEKK